MIYREREKLTIIQMCANEGEISFDRLETVILERPSNVIYCERNGELYGIITMGDIARSCKKFVTINTQFMCLEEGDYMKARSIFFKNAGINALPVVDYRRRLIGDWSRWDNYWLANVLHRSNAFSINTMKSSRIAFVRSGDEALAEKHKIYECYCKYLADSGAEVKDIRFLEIIDYMNDVDVVLALDEDEFRAADTWLSCMRGHDFLRAKIVTCRNLADYKIVDVCLQEIKRQGVYLINLYFEENAQYRQLRKNIANKFAEKGKKVSGKLHPDMEEEFFDDLYTEEYASSIMDMNFSVVNTNGCSVLKDCQSNFYNVAKGERFTIGVPDKYERTIYFVGPCYIYGHYVEDANTIESFLQIRLNRMGYAVKVVNCGSPSYSGRMIMELARIKELFLKKGDIVVAQFDNRVFHNIFNLNLTNILKEHSINPGWIIDELRHCNHKVNALYADIIYDALEPILDKTADEQGKLIEQDRDFIKTLYIDQYFSDFDPFIYSKIGSIVMNCNPFTFGHRYLIEQALKMVDFLIIFVVEEDKSLFTFDERFAMVYEGVADLENVLVVPSGLFILSQTTFPEYFVKEADEDLVGNIENDITLFAEKIAPHLNIRYRFVGEEPEDVVTNEYNLAMKRIFPKYDIEFVEIPRKQQDGKYISASAVRKCLEDNNMSDLKKLVPKSTVRVIFGE